VESGQNGKANRIGDRLESLWRKLDDLKRLESDLSIAPSPASVPVSEQIKLKSKTASDFSASVCPGVGFPFLARKLLAPTAHFLL